MHSSKLCKKYLGKKQSAGVLSITGGGGPADRLVLHQVPIKPAQPVGGASGSSDDSNKQTDRMPKVEYCQSKWRIKSFQVKIIISNLVNALTMFSIRLMNKKTPNL